MEIVALCKGSNDEFARAIFDCDTLSEVKILVGIKTITKQKKYASVVKWI